MSHRTLIGLAALVLSSVGSPAALAVVLTLGESPSSILSIAQDSSGDPVSTFEGAPITELPSAGEATAIQGESSATTSFSVSNDQFDFYFDHYREAGESGAAARSSVSVFFIPGEDVSYSFSGTYTAEDPAGRPTFLDVDLIDFTASEGRFSSRQTSTSTPNESFALGQLGGDSVSQLFGSQTGILAAGHQYQLIILVGLAGGIGPVPNPASGTGFVTLSFVPEPSVGLLLLGGLVTLAGIVRR
jgi:hypothetical protein